MLLGGDDGMVVGHPHVFDEPLLVDAETAGRVAGGAGTEGSVAQCPKPVGQGGHHVVGDVAAVGTGIGRDLVDLVELLQGVQRLFGREAKVDVGILLQGGQVVGERRFLAHVDLLHRDDLSFPAHQRIRQLLELLLAGDVAVAIRVLPGGAEGQEVRFQGVVEGAGEGVPFILPLGHQREGRRLDASGRELGVIVAGQRAGDVHADIPVRGGAALRRMVEVLVQAGGLQGGETFTDGLVGLAADPQPFRLSLVACHLHDPAGDQLPFASGVGGNHQAGDVVAGKESLDHLELLLALLDDHLLQGIGKHGQGAHRPALPRLVVICRWRQLHQMAQGPSDHIVGTFQIPLAAQGTTHHTSDFTGDARLFRKNQFFHVLQHTQNGSSHTSRDSCQKRLPCHNTLSTIFLITKHTVEKSNKLPHFCRQTLYQTQIYRYIAHLLHQKQIPTKNATYDTKGAHKMIKSLRKAFGLVCMALLCTLAACT